MSLRFGYGWGAPGEVALTSRKLELPIVSSLARDRDGAVEWDAGLRLRETVEERRRNGKEVERGAQIESHGPRACSWLSGG